MLRDKSLIPLSHQHQHALSLCVRIDRAHPIPAADLPVWQAEIEGHFAEEITSHFSAEEQEIFPAARQFPELVPLIEELIADHALLRKWFTQAQQRRMASEDLRAFGQELSAHIRREERQLFERLQQLMTKKELAILGAKLESALRDAIHTCAITNQTTRLKAKQ